MLLNCSITKNHQKTFFVKLTAVFSKLLIDQFYEHLLHAEHGDTDDGRHDDDHLVDVPWLGKVHGLALLTALLDGLMTDGILKIRDWSLIN